MELIEVSKLKPFPKNDYFFDDLTGPQWEEFKKSVQSSGVIEPVIVTTDLTIISGHQRVRACKELGIEKVLCDIRRFDSEDEQLKQLIETNIKQRGIGNPNSVKLGRCIRELERIEGIKNGGDRKSDCHRDNLITEADLAEHLNISQATLQRYKSLTNLIPELSDLVETGEVNVTTAAAIARKLTKEQQEELAANLTETDAGMLKSQLKEALNRNAGYIKEIQRLNNDLENQQIKEVVKTVEKIPADYEDLKKANVRLYNENKKHIEEAQEWERKFKESGKVEPTLDQKASKDIDWLTMGIMEFLRTYGGKAWGVDRRASIEQYRTDELKAQAKNLLAFAQNLYIMTNNDNGQKEAE